MPAIFLESDAHLVPISPTDALAARAPATPSSGRQRRVVVVEDDAAASSAIVRALEGLPMSLVVAPRREALARGGAGERFDIVITSLSQGETQDPYTALAPRRIFLGVGAFDGLGRFVLETPANTALEHPRFLAELRALVSERSQ